AYLAGTYPQVWMDLSLALPLAEPLAARLVPEALGLCPTGKLLAASDGHSYPEMHWWGATLWRRALERALGDEADADAVAGGGRAGNPPRLYRLGRAPRGGAAGRGGRSRRGGGGSAGRPPAPPVPAGQRPLGARRGLPAGRLE